MHATTRASRLMRSGNLAGQWATLSRARKRYAAHLVRDYGCPVKLAIQQAGIFGYAEWQYDHRAKRPVREALPAKAYGFR